MELQHVNVKILVDQLGIGMEQLIEVFHRWVAEQCCEELLIDVADYQHVPAGPGVLLVGHEADYALDQQGGRYGLLYNRKDVMDGSNLKRLQQAFRSAAAACHQLETELGDNTLQFSRQQFEIIVNDRALAPNTDETFQALQPELKAFVSQTLGHDQFQFNRRSDDPRCRFSVDVISDQPFDLAEVSTA